MTNSNSNVYRAALIAVHGPDITEQEAARSMEELAQLLRGLGIAPSHQLVQKRAVGGGIATYFGAGKLRELAALTGGSGEIHRGPPKTRPKPGELDPPACSPLSRSPPPQFLAAKTTARGTLPRR